MRSNAAAASAAKIVRTTATASRQKRGLAGPVFPFDQMVKALGKKDSRANRGAYYLDWCAAHAPKQYQPFNVIYQQSYGMKSLPRLDRKEVQALRNSIGSVRVQLQKKYGRDLDVAGNGCRATVDDDDTAAVTLPKKVKRLRSAKNSLIATHELIDPSKIRDARIKSYLNRSVKDVIKLVGSEDFDKRLLPPSESADEKA